MYRLGGILRVHLFVAYIFDLNNTLLNYTHRV